MQILRSPVFLLHFSILLTTVTLFQVTHCFSPLTLLLMLVMRTAQGAGSTTCSPFTLVTHQCLIWKLNMTVSLPTIYLYAFLYMPSYYLLQRPPTQEQIHPPCPMWNAASPRISITIIHKLVCSCLLLMRFYAIITLIVMMKLIALCYVNFTMIF